MPEPRRVDDLFSNRAPEPKVDWSLPEILETEKTIIHKPERQRSETITSGRNLERISTKGWQDFRTELTQYSFGQILDDYTSGPEQFSSIKNRSEQLSTQELQLLQEKLAEAQNLPQKLESTIDSNKASVIVDRSKKIAIIGKNRDHLSSQMTRIYVGCETQFSPSLFTDLVSQLQDEGALDQITLALNLENFDDKKSLCQTNSIIIYCQGKNPPMEHVARAIQKSKVHHPELWPQQTDTVRLFKEKFARDLMIPIDDTVSFVEMTGVDSYHSTVAGYAKQELLGRSLNISLDMLRTNMRNWTKDRPGEFSSDNSALKGRKKYMPALIS